MKNAMQQAMKGRTVTPKQQAVLDSIQAKTIVLVKEELDWESFEPLYIRLYRDHFTQQEIDGMIAFYQSPTGQALITKMPAIMQESVAEAQKRMTVLLPKLEKIQQDGLAELKAQSAE